MKKYFLIIIVIGVFIAIIVHWGIFRIGQQPSTNQAKYKEVGPAQRTDIAAENKRTGKLSIDYSSTQKGRADPILSLERLLLEEPPLSDGEYYRLSTPLIDSMIMKFNKGDITMDEFTDKIYEWLNYGNQRAKEIAIIMASEIGSIEMLKLISDQYALTEEPDMRRFILRRSSKISFEGNTNVSDVLLLIEKEADQNLKEAFTASVLKYGSVEITNWVMGNIQKSEAENRGYWIERLQYIHNEESFNALINIAEITEDKKITQAALNAIGSSDSPQAVPALFALVSEDMSSDNMNLISNSLSRAATDGNWSKIMDVLHFGEDVNKRIVAAKAYVNGYSLRDRLSVKGTLQKVISKEPPERLRKEIEQLLMELNA